MVLVGSAQGVHGRLGDGVRDRHGEIPALDLARDVVDVDLAAVLADVALGDLPRAVARGEEHLLAAVRKRRLERLELRGVFRAGLPEPVLDIVRDAPMTAMPAHPDLLESGPSPCWRRAPRR